MKINFSLACQLGPSVPATDCSQTCGNGTQLLNRTCYNIAASSYSVPQLCSNTSKCPTNTTSVGQCNPNVCLSKY
jgi:acetyl-CoA acetyltransferase